jgi:hypothetical protein
LRVAPTSDLSEDALNAVFVEEFELAVDAERYYVLRSVVTFRPDWEAAMRAAQAGAQGAFGGDLPEQRFTLRSEVREIVYDAEIDPERFVFTPPEGSTELDLAAFCALDALSGMDDEGPLGAPGRHARPRRAHAGSGGDAVGGRGGSE